MGGNGASQKNFKGALKLMACAIAEPSTAVKQIV
jgi:hypothetical protein